MPESSSGLPAAPAAVSPHHHKAFWFLLLAPLPSSAQTLYNFGNPTADEQLHIEYINRARANPAAEGVRLANTTDPAVTSAYTGFGVNLAMMQSEFNAAAAVPPLAPNGNLTTIARSHSSWMLANAKQTHDENGVDFSVRIKNAGYNYNLVGENIFASASSVFHGYAGFAVDWGDGASATGGMQNPRGHRNAILSAGFREIGVGMAYGTNGIFGPQSVTQDFGVTNPSPTFATGVAYYDMDGDDFYDAGEGISGLRVDVSGASYYCQTAAGGGWTVIIPDAASTRTVTFSQLGVNQTASITNALSKNTKADLKLTYSAPSITSPATAYNGSPYNLTFSSVPGAASYNWKRWTTSTAVAENADSTANVTSSTLGSYTVLNTTMKKQGTGSFHLVNAGFYPLQWIQLSPLYRGQASGAMTFQSQLFVSATANLFKVQVKEEGTSTWVDVDSQNGIGGSSPPTPYFSLRTVSLSSMANKNFRLRFSLIHTAGTSLYSGEGNDRGWFIDDIQFTNVLRLQNEVVTNLATNSGSFTPAATGTVIQAVFPVISGTDFPGAAQTLTVNAGPAPGFAAWAAAIESSGSLGAGSISNATGDYDKDGRSNFLEYAFGTSPTTASEAIPRWPAVSKSGGNVLLDYKTDTSLSGMTYVPQASTDLVTWKAPADAGAPAGFTDQLISTAGSIQTRRATVPVSSGAKIFLRVRAAGD